MLLYKDRVSKISPIPEPFIMGETKTDHWYSYLINEWIPNEPDAAELMDLFIVCDFNPHVFICKINPPA